MNGTFQGPMDSVKCRIMSNIWIPDSSGGIGAEKRQSEKHRESAMVVVYKTYESQPLGLLVLMIKSWQEVYLCNQIGLLRPHSRGID